MQCLREKLLDYRSLKVEESARPGAERFEKLQAGVDRESLRQEGDSVNVFSPQVADYKRHFGRQKQNCASAGLSPIFWV
jgi:hypothetical protein